MDQWQRQLREVVDQELVKAALMGCGVRVSVSYDLSRNTATSTAKVDRGVPVGEVVYDNAPVIG